MLTLKQVKDKCLYGQDAEQCRFLEKDVLGCFFCLKKTGDRNDIDAEVDEYIRKQTRQGVDPESLGIPINDNCSGYIFLRQKMQGYDIP